MATAAGMLPVGGTPMLKFPELFRNVKCLIRCLKIALRSFVLFVCFSVIIRIELRRRIEPVLSQNVAHRPNCPESLVRVLK